MSGARSGGQAPGQRSLQARLERLFAAREEATGKRPSYDSVARAINEAAAKDGTATEKKNTISGPYIWELTTGKSDNPKLRHLEALAKYFNVDVDYFVSDSAEDQLTPRLNELQTYATQLELLEALKEAGVHGLAVEVANAGLSPESLETLKDMVKFLGEKDSKGRPPASGARGRSRK
ncbi:hypothetical protein HOK021_16820 [Streptomyces hygroscopicus]|nr:hypothetical protein HOK021_16820 [Streptomyces hygroscopicus]